MTREEQLDWLYRLKSKIYVYMPKEWINPIHDALIMTIKALEQEHCDDAISRQQAIDKMQELEEEDIEAYGCSIPEGFDGKRAIEALKTLSSVHPKPKVGQWIVHPKGIYAHLVCDKCLSNAPYDCRINYCPNCGAKMEVEQDVPE